MARKKQLTRFSDYFQLNKRQSELDFVDIPMETDIKLYVDPYALNVASQDWLRECSNNIITYFENLVEKIREDDERAVLQLLDNFHEPNETHLGQSSGNPKGRGWGRGEAKKLLNVLKASTVVQTGNLSDLGDYEMFIPGIGPDKISDLATNIIKGDLLEYTREQCDLWSIPTEEINPGKIWDPGTGKFITRYAHLPVYDNGPIILVPKTAVRMRLVPNRESFYSRFILDYLESEHLSANDSLVHVLKGGKKKVFRKELRERYPYTPEMAYKFAQKHPEILSKYKESLPNQAKPISNINIEWTHKNQRFEEDRDYAAELSAIRPGAADASKYHNLILGGLQAIFYPQLSHPVKEKEVNEGRKRIDIKFDNASDTGFFSHLVNRHKMFAPYVSVECKNYSEDPENPEFDQLQGRFSKKRGNVGLLICRSLDKRALIIRRCKDIVNDTEGVILVLEDSDILELLRRKTGKGDDAVDEFMQERLAEVLF